MTDTPSQLALTRSLVKAATQVVSNFKQNPSTVLQKSPSTRHVATAFDSSFCMASTVVSYSHNIDEAESVFCCCIHDIRVSGLISDML